MELKKKLLEVNGLTVSYGGIVAVKNVSFEVIEGEILAIIGPNGAGKTTLFNTLTLLTRPSSGEIRWRGQSLRNKLEHQVCSLGISRTFQNLALFSSMSVFENAMVGTHARSVGGFVSFGLNFNTAIEGERKCRERVKKVLEFVGLSKYAFDLIDSLPYSLQKRLEIARALASSPTLLLVDEPAGGLNAEEVEELCELLQKIRNEMGVTIVLIEHHMGLVMKMSDRIIVMHVGKKIAEDIPVNIRSNKEVVTAYLGDGGE